jgi:hypothetical protein
LIWSVILALTGAFFAWETGKQLYTAAMKGYILTGRSMNRRVDRKTDGKLFRNNLIANLMLFPLFAGGFVMFSLAVLEGLAR